MGFKHLGSLTSLTRLSLGHSQGIADGTMESFGNLTALRDLTWESCNVIATIGAWHLALLPSLSAPHLYGCETLIDKDASCLGFLTNVSQLTLGFL